MFRFIGWIALAIGGYFAYTRRFALQRVLESYGIRTPLDRTDVESTLRSGAAKAAGSIKHEIGKTG